MFDPNFLFYLNILAYYLWVNLEYAKIHMMGRIRTKLSIKLSGRNC